ncbi:MAG: hypothetical protein J6A92_00770 [Lachnospiraceae bacterium]|nr:hypothetical protein [Lachnospiraceae bacterium]
MAITISTNADAVKGLFSSSSMFNSTDMLGINYMDYASIRNGSYGKLLSAYYDLNKTEESSKTNKTEDSTKDKNSSSATGTSASTSTSTSSVAADKLAAIESSAEKAKEAADKLLTQGSGSIFNQTAVKDSEGNVATDASGNAITDYDRDKITSAVKDFVGKYNDMMTNASSASVSSIKSTASALKYQTLMYKEELASVGITINDKDNTLSIDEEAFKTSNMSSVKKLFNGTNSFAYKVSEQASDIDKYAAHEASRANTYTSSGKYSSNSNVGEILNDLI